MLVRNLIIVLRQSLYDKWFAKDGESPSKLEYQLKKYIEEDSFIIIGMSNDKIILYRPDNPSRRQNESTV